MTTTHTAEDNLRGLAQGDPKLLDTLAQMNVGTLERSGLDDETYLLARIAALVATDAAPVSYLVSLGVADEIGVDLDKVLGIMVAIAPVVGGARIASATSKMARAGILGAELAELYGSDEPE